MASAGRYPGRLLPARRRHFCRWSIRHAHQVFVPCPFRLATGLYSPFCGGLRIVHDLAHAHEVRAFHDNQHSAGHEPTSHDGQPFT
jgi:hypothetical protein